MNTKQIVLASGNPKKINELQKLLGDSGYQILAQSDFDTPEAIEDGLSFVENAIIKARNACLHSGLPAIADDSGLEVDALQGKPGIYSARYAGANATDASNNEKLLADMNGIDEAQRSARFQCVLVYMRHAQDPTPIICQGSWEGRILNAPQGANGFGYDPLFYVPSQQCSSAQLSPELKNALSHRGLAMQQLALHLNEN
ncbi:RdgB/HAM1 family non-canonical purine NTP pyrophosphatase [Dasania marina]|uniref:RdgB/HAM1 family non-canonical purine NTP pyrophosphatase n=1 Tax=Dasania marina TaxID=471499 RepID=UPI00037EACF2|nr:RdgB/HAM1 family non-canonical purine NTP pyrophosphatase [Dasania marina]